MKYKDNFNRDYEWYLKYKDTYIFDGSNDDSKIIVDLVNGKDAKFCFFKYDSTGKVIPTSEPELLSQIYRCKGSINFHIKMWSEGVAERTSFMVEFRELDLLDWMLKGIRNQADRIGYTDWEGRLKEGSRYTNL